MEWFEELRTEFPAFRNQIYMDVASSNCTPTSVLETITDYWKKMSMGEGHSTDTALRVLRTRERLARLVNCKPNEIAFVRSTADGINIVAQGIPWQAGDTVVINDQDHSSNVIPWLNLEKRGVRVKVARSENYRVAIDSLVREMDTRTRAVAISFVQHRSGFRADLATLGRICRERGIWLVVDGIQGIGSMRFDAQAMGVHAMSAGGYKHVLGVAGSGFLYCAGELLEQMKPAYAGPSAAVKINKENGWHLEVPDLRDARRLEGGSLNTAGILAFEPALNLIERCGMGNIESRILSLASRLASGLSASGYTLVSPMAPGEQSGLVSVSVPSAQDFDEYLKAHRIMGSIKEATILRLSVHAYNLEWEVDRVVEIAAVYKNR